MDPKETLKRAVEALLAGDNLEAIDAIGDYQSWRVKGGFMPSMGLGLTGDDLCESVINVMTFASAAGVQSISAQQ